MSNPYFSFKQFTIRQDKCAFKVGTDGVILGAVAETAHADRILDIGSGTGLIAIMLAQRSMAEITAIEQDRESFLQMQENIEACRWRDKIKPIHCRLQDFIPGTRFHLIVANPPYFINSLRNPDARKSAARHNTDLSHEELLQGVSRLIENDGTFQVIMPVAEGKALISEAINYGLYCNEILRIKPDPDSEAVRFVIKFTREKKEATDRLLIIGTGERHVFSEAYKALTKDFYLNF